MVLNTKRGFEFSGLAIILDNPMISAAKKYPDFFKVFFPEKHYERMLIPKAFVKLVAISQGRIPENVILRNCNGRGWRVKTHSIGDNLYFDDGWKVFREENSLEEVDFLVFKYDGINEFRFIILEPSTSCEKTIVKEEEEEQGKENENVAELEEEEITEEEEVQKIEIKEEEHEEIQDCVMEDREEQSLEEDSEDDDSDDDDHNNEEGKDGYDDSDSDEYTDMEEENEEENTAGNMRSQCHHRARKIGSRETPTSSYTKARDPQLEDYEVEAEMYIQPDNPYFVAKLYKSRPNELHIPTNVIKDYSLIFPAKVTLVCCQCKDKQKNEVREYHLSLPQQTIVRKKYKEVEGELCTWKDGRLCIQGWTSFCRKNKINEKDVCLCEIVVEEEQFVKLLQVHVLGAKK